MLALIITDGEAIDIELGLGRERAGSKWRQAIAAKQESQYHCQR